MRQVLERLDRIEQLLHQLSFKPMSVQEAASYLGISRSYLYRMTSQSLIPHYKPGGKKIYFEKGDRDQWIKRARLSTRDEIEKMADEYPRSRRK